MTTRLISLLVILLCLVFLPTAPVWAESQPKRMAQQVKDAVSNTPKALAKATRSATVGTRLDAVLSRPAEWGTQGALGNASLSRRNPMVQQIKPRTTPLPSQQGKSADRSQGPTVRFNVVARDVTPGRTIYRNWSGGARSDGRSWTTVDPRTVKNFSDAAGLPAQNAGKFVTEGTLINKKGVSTRLAVPLDGNKGGLLEVVIPNPRQQVKLNPAASTAPQITTKFKGVSVSEGGK